LRDRNGLGELGCRQGVFLVDLLDDRAPLAGEFGILLSDVLPQEVAAEHLGLLRAGGAEGEPVVGAGPHRHGEGGKDIDEVAGGQLLLGQSAQVALRVHRVIFAADEFLAHPAALVGEAVVGRGRGRNVGVPGRQLDADRARVQGDG
jgi:hypothetical protein